MPIVNRRNLVWFVPVLVLIGFSFGIYVDHFRVFPYELLKYGYKYIKVRLSFADSNPSDNVRIDNQQITELLTINSTEQLRERRDLLKGFIWGRQSSSRDFKLSITPLETPASLKDCVRASRKLVVDMPYGFDSVLRYLESRKRTDQLVVVHRGHNTEDPSYLRSIRALCANGFDLLLADLLMLGDNSRPTVSLDNIGRVAFTNHDQLKYIESSSFNPLVLFIAPLSKGIDYARSLQRYRNISLIGISGGASIVTLFAAVDDRITRTYAIAGVAPAFLRFAIPKTYWGDYEQTHPGLARILSDLDLYVMAAYGQSRKYTQVYNLHDPCCFPGAAFETYSNVVSERIRQLGYGTYEVWLDQKNLDHGLSKEMLSRIIQIELSEGERTAKTNHGIR